MYKMNCLLYIFAVSTTLAILVSVLGSDESEEARRAHHKRRKRPCGKDSPRWFFAHDITILLGDLTVVNSVPCGSTGLPQKPILNSGQKPGLLGQHHHHHQQGGGLLGSHFQGGNHQQGGGLLGSHFQGGNHHQGGGLLGSHQQGGGLFGSHHQGGGLLGGLFGGHQQGGGGNNGQKPVYEHLEEDSDSPTSSYKPGAVVGALSGQVSGFEQDLSHLSVLDRINDHVGRLLKPFVDLFVR